VSDECPIERCAGIFSCPESRPRVRQGLNMHQRPLRVPMFMDCRFVAFQGSADGEANDVEAMRRTVHGCSRRVRLAFATPD
jgi:hypothetical protein